MIPENIRAMPAWCVSKNKVPLDMFVLGKGLEWGVSTKRSHCCYTDYEKALGMSARTGYPLTIWADSGAQGICVLDIEAACPAELRRAILTSLSGSVMHLERSLSGKGYHVMVSLPNPEPLLNAKFRKWFEILTLHHCVLTGREISLEQACNEEFPENAPLEGDSDENDLLGLLAEPTDVLGLHKAIAKGSAVSVRIESAGLAVYKAAAANFGAEHADLFNSMCDFRYEKTVDKDFHGDWSSYEFGYASKLHYLLRRLAADMMDAHANHYSVRLSKEDAVMLVYMALKQSLPARDKHSSFRNGLPWLLYTSERVYAKSFE